MQPADDATRDYRTLVERGYDAVATTFNAARSAEDDAVLAPLIERLAAPARVLDLGCGAGVPIARALAKRYDVTGIDISSEQIALACRQVPEATFIRADMSSVAFEDASFDAVVSLYAIFHLPREDHEPLLRGIHRWLAPGGYLLATFATHDEAPYTEDFFGTEMYWSNYGIDAYRRMLTDIGFTVLRDATLGHGYGDDPHARPESHPLILAQKLGGTDDRRRTTGRSR